MAFNQCVKRNSLIPLGSEAEHCGLSSCIKGVSRCEIEMTLLPTVHTHTQVVLLHCAASSTNLSQSSLAAIDSLMHKIAHDIISMEWLRPENRPEPGEWARKRGEEGERGIDAEVDRAGDCNCNCNSNREVATRRQLRLTN